ncbi:MAG: flagellar protein FlgN [Oscillospiraceae bacterium]|nr:flagellar protein FlgN [Oscillospiraceae bacterium]
MSKIPSADKERLIELLKEKLKIYKQIKKHTEEQTELLAKDDIEAFDSSLDKREKLIEKINGLHQETETLMQSYVSAPEDGKEKNPEIDNLEKEIREVLTECASLNDDNIAMMKEKTEEHIKKIEEQSAKRKGIGGYAQSVPNTPEVFDKKT